MGMRTILIAMNGVTGRMGTNQHLVRSILSLRSKGGVILSNGERVMPEPILVGRNAEKVEALAKQHGVARWSTDLAKTLADPAVEIYFDAQATPLRVASVEAAINAGKHVYCEKPLAEDSKSALRLAALAKKSGRKCGIVQDKLFLPGFRKLKQTIDSGFLGRMISVRCEFGYWVFEGDLQPAKRPSWNYRKEDGGGIILDMFAHWQYVIEGILGRIEAVSCIATTHIPKRVARTASGTTRPRTTPRTRRFSSKAGFSRRSIRRGACACHRDELVALQVDGTHWHRHRRTARLQNSASGEHAARGVESGHSVGDRFLRGLAGCARRDELSERIRSAVGIVFAARGGGRSVPARFRTRGARRDGGGGGDGIVARTPLGGRTGDAAGRGRVTKGGQA
jgi:predicted dehydrogenase